MNHSYSFARALSVVLLTLVLLSATGCNQPPPIQGSGPSSNIQVVPGSGGNWAHGQFKYPYGPISGKLLELINGHRLALHLNILAWHDGMAVAAIAHSKDMTNQNYLSIVNPQGVDVYERMVSCNPRIDFDNAYGLVGENGSDAAHIFNALYASPAGRFVMESPELTHFGCKTTQATGVPVQRWCLLFAQNARP